VERNVPKIKKSTRQGLTPSRRTATKASATASVAEQDQEDTPQQSTTRRSLDVLRHVARSSSPIPLADLAEELQLPKTTVHRICLQLTAQQFLTQNVHNKGFGVGRELRMLALDALRHDSLRGLRHQVLANLVNEVGETCNLTALDGTEVLYLDRVEARCPLRLTLDIGSRVPLHCTASGKLFLSQMDANDREKILSHLKLEKVTPNTIASKEKLEKALVDIKRKGFSIDAEEFVLGLIALAVPIFDDDKRVVAALAVHAPTSRVPLSKIMDWLPPLLKTSEKLTSLL